MGFYTHSNDRTVQRYRSSSIQEYQCLESWISEKRTMAETPYTSMRMLRKQRPGVNTKRSAATAPTGVTNETPKTWVPVSLFLSKPRCVWLLSSLYTKRMNGKTQPPQWCHSRARNWCGGYVNHLEMRTVSLSPQKFSPRATYNNDGRKTRFFGN